MKKKKYYYNHHFPIDGGLKAWLEYKDFYHTAWKWHFSVKRFYGIELHPKTKHRRSWLVRKRFTLLGWEHDNHKFFYVRDVRILGRKKRGKWLSAPRRGVREKPMKFESLRDVRIIMSLCKNVCKHCPYNEENHDIAACPHCVEKLNDQALSEFIKYIKEV